MQGLKPFSQSEHRSERNQDNPFADNKMELTNSKNTGAQK